MTLQPRYLVPLLALSATIAAFFLVRRFRAIPPRAAFGIRLVAAGPLLASGTLHLLRPQLFMPLLPAPLPPAAWLIVATGLPELLGAIGLFVPRTRRPAALALAVFMVAIFPANIHVAGRTVAGLPMPGVAVRAGMQAIYIILLLVAGWGVPTFCRPAASSTFVPPKALPHP